MNPDDVIQRVYVDYRQYCERHGIAPECWEVFISTFRAYQPQKESPTIYLQPSDTAVAVAEAERILKGARE